MASSAQFALLHWSYCPLMKPLDMPKQERKTLSMLHRAALLKEKEACLALVFPICNWQQLLEAFESHADDDDDDGGVDIRRGIAAVLLRWITHSFVFTEVPETIMHWIAKMLSNRALDPMIRSLFEAAVPFFAPATVSERDVPSSNDESLWNWASDPADFASQLTAFDERLTRRLTAADVFCLGTYFGLDRDGVPCIANQLALCLPAFVATQIVRAEHPHRMISHFLQAVRHLWRIQSLNAFALVMRGLLHPAIQRLTNAWNTALNGQSATDWNDLCKWFGGVLALAIEPRARNAPASPYVSGYQLSAARDAATLPSLVQRFLRATWVCTHAIPLHAEARHFFMELAPRDGEHTIGMESLRVQADSTGGIVSSVRSWLFSSSSSSPSMSARVPLPPLFLTANDWEKVFAGARLLRFDRGKASPPLLEEGATSISMWRVRRGKMGHLAEGQIFCEWNEPLNLGEGIVVEVEHAVVSLLESGLRLRVLKALCVSLASGGASFPLFPMPPLLLHDEEQAKRWATIVKFNVGDILLRKGQRVDGAYFLVGGKCSLGRVVPGLDVEEDVLVLENGTSVAFVSVIRLEASRLLATVVFEHLALHLQSNIKLTR